MLESEDEESLIPSTQTKKDSLWKSRRLAREQHEPVSIRAVVIGLMMSLAFLLGLLYWLLYVVKRFKLVKLITYGSFSDISASEIISSGLPCDTVSQGYQCDPTLSHSWGQYSLFYRVPSDFPLTVPSLCKVTFVQLLSRHGARFPTADKSAKYNSTISKIKSSATNFTGPYSFLDTYIYDLGAEDLTVLGQQELVNSGVDFFSRYEELAEIKTPFVRAGDQDRVVESARKWSEGYHKAKVASGKDSDKDYPYGILEISEASDVNNTLHHGLCRKFEQNRTGFAAQMEFGKTFLPGITARLKSDLKIDNIDDLDTLSLMDMCPFTVVAETSFTAAKILQRRNPSSNPVCALFNQSEWEAYDYFQTIGKYYGFGPGAPLGPTQGVGYVNELIARLTTSEVKDRTSVNHTLDASSATFPLDRQIYADFSHDNDMTSIFSALGLFEKVPTLNKDRIMGIEETAGFASSRIVPFGGRILVEKLQCEGTQDEKVRVILNGRVWPLSLCDLDDRGMCNLQEFVQSLRFAKSGGRWDECFDDIASNASSGTVETA